MATASCSYVNKCISVLHNAAALKQAVVDALRIKDIYCLWLQNVESYNVQGRRGIVRKIPELACRKHLHNEINENLWSSARSSGQVTHHDIYIIVLESEEFGQRPSSTDKDTSVGRRYALAWRSSGLLILA
jgi:hypothetical protein